MEATTTPAAAADAAVHTRSLPHRPKDARSLPFRRLFSASTVLAAAALLSACGRSDLSERPPVDNGGGSMPIVAQPSTIGALVSIPLADVIKAANNALPRGYSQDWTNGGDVCADLGLLGKHCVGTKYKYNVSRGEIAISAAGANALKLSVEVSVDGQGGFRGNGAELVGVDKKNFDAAARFDIVFTPTMGPDWCPTMQVAPSYTWTKSPRVEIVSKVNVDVSEPVSKALNSKIPEIVQSLQSAINCAQFKSQLASLYGKRSFPVEVAPGQNIHVDVEPLDFAFSGLNVDAQFVRLAAMLTARLEVSGTPVPPSALPLPALKTIGVGAPPRISLAVPVRAPFTMIQTEAQKLVGGKTFRGNTAAGEVTVTVNKVEAYPTSGGKIAVGLDFDAKLPGKLLDTKGIVFVIGTPSTEGRTVVRLKDPTFTRILDNDLWNAMSVLFDSQIRGELARGLRYDFSNEVEKVRKALADKLADPTAIPNARAKVTDVEIGLGRVTVDGTNLVAEALFAASLTLEPDLVGLVAQK